MSDDLKIRMPEWARHMYNRLLAKIDAGGGTRSVSVAHGASGSFTTSDGKTVTVTDGVVTNINSEERR